MPSARKIQLAALVGAAALVALALSGVRRGDAAVSTGGSSGSAGRAAAGALAKPTVLQTGVVDPSIFGRPDSGVAVAKVRGAGAAMIRLILYWKGVAPGGPTRPAGFDPSNPGDPAYFWTPFDKQVGLAVAHGLEPIVSIEAAPLWAEDTTVSGSPATRAPDPAELARFARAAAVRYGGRFQGLPRVRYWQVWNEPNFSGFLNPQSPALYRTMVNAFADAVHGVHRDNAVIAGGLSPFGFKGVAYAPLLYMRSLLSKRIRFDIWADHPYTTGGPTHRATNPGDVSLGDLPAMKQVLNNGIRTGRIASRGRIRFWVTEFSWDSDPPDPVGVPAKLHARWVAEALYRMYRVGISEVTWFQLRDNPLRTSEFQSGLYFDSGASYASAKPKLALRAFRFPFVALGGSGGVTVWGRTPWGRPGRVAVQRQVGSTWRNVATLQSDRYGIFTARLASVRRASYRARLASGDASLAFSLVRPPDHYYWPFGCGGILPCS